VKVKRAHADGPGVVKDECWILADGPEQPGDQPWWFTPKTHSREDVAERAMLSAWSRTGGTHIQDMGDAHMLRYSRRFGG
jgi:hypothetical protein